jgi:hypothetical protein
MASQTCQYRAPGPLIAMPNCMHHETLTPPAPGMAAAAAAASASRLR